MPLNQHIYTEIEQKRDPESHYDGNTNDSSVFLDGCIS